MQTDLNQELIVREIVRAIIEKKNNSNGIFIPVAFIPTVE